MDYTVQGILQAKILERVAFPFSKGSSQPRDWTQVSRIGGRRFNLWAVREALTNLNSILKSRDIILPTKVCLVKAMVLTVVMYGCELDSKESWAQKNWCFWTVGEGWRRLLRVLWTARRSNQSILKEISPGCSLEGLMLKLKLQYFGYVMRRAGSFEMTLILGKIEGRRRRGWQRMRQLDGTTDSMDMSLGGLLGVGDGQGGLACCSP